MSEPCQNCNSENTKMVIRAREYKDQFGNQQIFECRECEQRFPV